MRALICVTRLRILITRLRNSVARSRIWITRSRILFVRDFCFETNCTEDESSRSESISVRIKNQTENVRRRPTESEM